MTAAKARWRLLQASEPELLRTGMCSREPTFLLRRSLPQLLQFLPIRRQLIPRWLLPKMPLVIIDSFSGYHYFFVSNFVDLKDTLVAHSLLVFFPNYVKLLQFSLQYCWTWIPNRTGFLFKLLDLIIVYCYVQFILSII